MLGICRLCLREAEMKESHIWSSFLYKTYVSDPNKGGSFVNVHDGRIADNQQIRRHWLCGECEGKIGRSEDKVARLLRRFERGKRHPLPYDESLLRFATSISWRFVLYKHEHLNRGLIEEFCPAVKHWRKYLHGGRSDLGGFSQHAFLIFDDRSGMHRILGGRFLAGSGIVLTQAGPLLIVGLLGRRHIPKADLEIWKRSEIGTSGSLFELTEWRVGRNITLDFGRILADHEGSMRFAVKQLVDRHRPTVSGWRSGSPGA